MVLFPVKILLDGAARGGYAIGAYNVNNMEQAQGIMKAAVETQSPVIFQVSRGALKYSDKVILRDIIFSLSKKHPEIPIALHLDHGNSPESCFEAIELGFTSVMIDGSLLEDGKTPSDYEYNKMVTKKVVEFAHSRGVSVEAEIGRLGGIEDGHGSGEEKVTNPEDLKKFFLDCGMDSCAIAWGTSHGAYKGIAGKPPILRHDIIQKCHELVPEVHLVSHGSSSVPESLVHGINIYGVIKKYKDTNGHRHITGYGKDFDLESTDPREIVNFFYEAERMPKSVGVPMSDLQQAIKEGMRKINVDTDGRMAVTGAILAVLEANPKEFDPRNYLGPSRDAITEFAKQGMIGFGCAGRAKEFL